MFTLSICIYNQNVQQEKFLTDIIGCVWGNGDIDVDTVVNGSPSPFNDYGVVVVWDENVRVVTL